MAPVTLMGSTGCLLWSLALAPDYFQASKEPRLLKTSVLAEGGERGEGCVPPEPARSIWHRAGAGQGHQAGLLQIPPQRSLRVWKGHFLDSGGCQQARNGSNKLVMETICQELHFHGIYRRITGWLKLEGTTGGHPGQPPCSGWAPQSSALCPDGQAGGENAVSDLWEMSVCCLSWAETCLLELDTPKMESRDS